MELLDKNTLWSHLTKVSWLILRLLHMTMNAPLKGPSSFKRRRWYIPNFKRTCYMKCSTKVADVSSRTGTTTTNWVISHIIFIRATLPLLSAKWPSTQRSAWRFEKGELTGHENITSWHRRRHLCVNIQWRHWYTQFFISVLIRIQKKRNFKRYNVLYSTIWPAASEAYISIK